MEFIMQILWIILVGFVVGLVARFIKPGNDNKGFIMTSFVGIIGALLGSFLGQVLGIYRQGEPAGFIGAVIGAVLVLAILKGVNRKQII